MGQQHQVRITVKQLHLQQESTSVRLYHSLAPNQAHLWQSDTQQSDTPFPADHQPIRHPFLFLQHFNPSLSHCFVLYACLSVLTFCLVLSLPTPCLVFVCLILGYLISWLGGLSRFELFPAGIYILLCVSPPITFGKFFTVSEVPTSCNSILVCCIWVQFPSVSLRLYWLLLEQTRGGLVPSLNLAKHYLRHLLMWFSGTTPT